MVRSIVATDASPPVLALARQKNYPPREELSRFLKNFPSAAELDRVLRSHGGTDISLTDLTYYWCAAYRIVHPPSRA